MSVTKDSVMGVGESLAENARKLGESYTRQLDLEMKRIDQRYDLYQQKAALEKDPDRRRSIRKDMNACMTDELDAVDDRVLKQLIYQLEDICHTASIQLQKMASNVDQRQSLRQESVLPTQTAEWLESIEETIEQPDTSQCVETAAVTNAQETQTCQSALKDPTNPSNPTSPTTVTSLSIPNEADLPEFIVLDSPQSELSELVNADELPIQREETEQLSAQEEETQGPMAQLQHLANGQSQAEQRQPNSTQPESYQFEETTGLQETSSVADPQNEDVTVTQAPSRLRRTTRAVNVFSTRSSAKRQAERQASRPRSSKRQRSAEPDSPLCTRSVSFDDVYQNGEAAQKREILRRGNFFYYVECTEHSEVYSGKTNSFKAVSKHFRGEKHRPESAFENSGAWSVILPRFGVHVTGCTNAKAAMNNKLLQRALAVNLDYQQAGRFREVGANRRIPTTSELDGVLLGTLKPWNIYSGFVAGVLRPVPIVALPVTGTITSMSLLPDHKEAYLRGMPSCVRFDKKDDMLLGWADGYKDGQAQARQRVYPVLGFKGTSYPKNVVMEWATIEELCALRFDPSQTGDDKRQRENAKWFAGQQQLGASTTTRQPLAPSTPTNHALEPELLPTPTSPAETNTNAEYNISAAETATSPGRSNVNQEHVDISDDSDDDLPTIDEIMSSPVTPRQKRDGASEGSRGRSVTVDINTALPLHPRPSKIIGPDISYSVSNNWDAPGTEAAHQSWFREERPARGRAAQPVMGYPTRPSPITEESDPRLSKRSTDSRFTMRATKRKVVKLQVNPGSLQQVCEDQA